MLDRTLTYTVDGYRGVAFYIKRDHEDGWVTVVMIGDDREHLVEADTLTPLPPDGYCRGCGQVGCTHEVYT